MINNNLYYKKYLKYKYKYNQLKGAGGLDTPEEKKELPVIDAPNWFAAKYISNFHEDKKCKIFFTFDGAENENDSYYVKFRELPSEEEKKNVMKEFLFKNDFFNQFKYYECSTTKHVIFYQIQRLKQFLYVLELFGIIKTEKELLELACVWSHDKTEEENLLLDICFGNTTICKSTGDNNKYNTPLYDLTEPIWVRNPNIKNAYYVYLGIIYGNEKYT